MTIFAPILTREHAHDDDEADNECKSHDEAGGDQPDAQLLVQEAPYVAVTDVSGSR
jgi:hypothetical protein